MNASAKFLYDSIESMLKVISVNRRALIAIEGEREEVVDKFIAEVGGREVDRTRYMNGFEVISDLITTTKELEGKVM